LLKTDVQSKHTNMRSNFKAWVLLHLPAASTKEIRIYPHNIFRRFMCLSQKTAVILLNNIN